MSEGDGFSRRDLFRLTVLGGAAVGLAGCGLVPEQKRRPVVGPEADVTTVCTACAAGCGIHVRTIGGNAVAIGGTLDHPINGGGVCPRGSAEIQHLYHPDRLTGPVARTARGQTLEPVSWPVALGRLAALRGGGLVFGIGALTAPEQHLVGHLAARLGAQIVRAVPLPPSGGGGFSVDLAHADLVLSLGVDWLQDWPSPVEAQRAFAALRLASPRGRLWTAEPRLSLTAGKSDHWLPVRRDRLGRLGLALAAHLLARGGGGAVAARHQLGALLADPALRFAAVAAELGVEASRLDTLIDELTTRRRPVVIASPELAPVALLLNALLGAVGREGGLLATRAPALPPELAAPALPVLDRVPEKTRAIVLVRANPLYLQPSSSWVRALADAELVVSLSPLLDESALAAHLVLPPTTSLESRQLAWGVTGDGAPLVSAGPLAVKPLYDTREPVRLLLELGRAAGAVLPWADADAYHEAIAAALGAQDVLATGGFVRPEMPAAAAPPDAIPALLPVLAGFIGAPALVPGELALEIVRPLAFAGGDGGHLPFLHGIAGPGGRELWDSIVELHTDTAARLGVKSGARLRLASAHGSIEGRAEVREGIRPDTVAVALGLGRRALARYAKGGANPLELGAASVRVTRQS